MSATHDSDQLDAVFFALASEPRRRMLDVLKAEPGCNVNGVCAHFEAEFGRFAVMKRWYDADHMSFDSFVSPDGLHMNDWSYACMAKVLGLAIAEAARRPVMSATAGSRNLAP